MRSFIISDDAISIIVNGKSYCVPRSCAQAPQVLKVLSDPKATDEDIVRVVDLALAVKSYSQGDIVLSGGVATYKGETLAPAITKRLFECMEQDVPYDTLTAFIKKLYANPSRRAVQGLYAFLEHESLPITPDGTFLAYKAIRVDWTDKYSGKFSNKIGNTLTMLRQKVDDDAAVGCSYGFHVGSLKYVEGFARNYGNACGDRIVIVEVNPADVVSVPHDSGHQKVRVCSYRVVDEFSGKLPGTASVSGDRCYESLSRDEDNDGDFDKYSGDDVVVLTEDELEDKLQEARDEAVCSVKTDMRDSIGCSG